MQNIYAPPRAPVDDSGNRSNPNLSQVDATVIDSLRRTRLWAKMVGILLFVSVIITCVTLVAVVMGNKFLAGETSFEMITAAMSNSVSLIAEFFFGLLLLKYAANIEKLSRTRQMRDLETAMRTQRQIWKYLGIFVLVFIGLIVFAMIGGVIFGIATMGMQ